MNRTPKGASTPERLGIDPEVWSRQVMDASPHHALGLESDPVESIRIIAHAIDPSIPDETIRSAAAERPLRFRAALLSVEPDVLALLEQLRGAGIKLALISNAGLDEIAAWSESPLAPFFATTLFSCYEGVMKPDTRIYERAAERLDVKPANCLYVGDGGSHEHEGARQAGMRTVLFLGLLARKFPAIAARRPRTTDWTADSVADLTRLILRLRNEGLAASE
jgi:putative hydrolase of the HAD superfamily